MTLLAFDTVSSWQVGLRRLYWPSGFLPSPSPRYHCESLFLLRYKKKKWAFKTNSFRFGEIMTWYFWRTRSNRDTFDLSGWDSEHLVRQWTLITNKNSNRLLRFATSTRRRWTWWHENHGPFWISDTTITACSIHFFLLEFVQGVKQLFLTPSSGTFPLPEDSVHIHPRKWPLLWKMVLQFWSSAIKMEVKIRFHKGGAVTLTIYCSWSKSD